MAIYDVDFDENGKTVTLTVTCPFCGKKETVTAQTIDFLEWNNGVCIQNAMPYLSASDRELLISGICKECQKKIFGEEE